MEPQELGPATNAADTGMISLLMRVEAGVPCIVANTCRSAEACCADRLTNRRCNCTRRTLSALAALQAAARRDGAPLDTERVQAVQALVCSGLTSVLYMVIAHVAEIQRALLAASMAPDMPAAVVSQTCTPRQRHASCRLDPPAHTVRDAALPSRALLVVGRLVRAAAMRATTSWPLSCQAA
jgi:siroheme synthase